MEGMEYGKNSQRRTPLSKKEEYSNEKTIIDQKKKIDQYWKQYISSVMYYQALLIQGEKKWEKQKIKSQQSKSFSNVVQGDSQTTPENYPTSPERSPTPTDVSPNQERSLRRYPQPLMLYIISFFIVGVNSGIIKPTELLIITVIIKGLRLLKRHCVKAASNSPNPGKLAAFWNIVAMYIISIFPDDCDLLNEW